MTIRTKYTHSIDLHIEVNVKTTDVWTILRSIDHHELIEARVIKGKVTYLTQHGTDDWDLWVCFRDEPHKTSDNKRQIGIWKIINMRLKK